MPVFLYKALDARGRQQSDEIVAESVAAARQMLRGRGLHPVDVWGEAQRSRPGQRLLPALWRKERLSFAELVGFTRQLATLLGAGVQIVPAFGMLIRMERRETSRRILTRIREAVNEGQTLAGAMEAFPRLFSPLYVSMVRAGESSGSLGTLLTRLADYLEHQQALRRRLSAALAYPILMAVTGAAVLVFLLIFVVPNVVKIFRQAHQDLPLPTRILIGTSDFVGSHIALLLLALGALAAAGAAWSRTEAGRRFFDGFVLRLPFLGPVLHKRIVARFGRTLSVLLSAGLPILEAVEIAKLVMGNTVLEEAAGRAREATQKGGRFGASLERTGMFPVLFTDMVGVGEQSGSLEGMLAHVSKHFDEETDASVQAMVSLVDPLIILVMGGVVGFVVVAILLPLFEINQLVR